MPLSASEFQKEQDYLDTVMAYLTHLLDKSRETLKREKSEVIELNRTMMEDIGNDVQSLGKFVDAYSYLVELGSRAGAMHGTEEEYARLMQMAKSPYFARMDFRTGEGEPMKVYIGISSLLDERHMSFYVFDWRSPIAGMYYDFEPGEAAYESPGGRVDGEIVLKRQFQIWNGVIEAAYDSALAIEDDILSEVLQKSADSKMQSIVCTIQREQNAIIRNRDSRCLIAFGPAGSGKTSVAMQRAAFFLYAYRDSITAANLMIFSPNRVFGDYISEVLPRLGESNIKSTPFTAFAEELFGGEYRFLPEGEFLDFSVHGQGLRKKAAALKLSDRFAEALIEKIERLSGTAPHFPDMVYGGKTLLSGFEMDRLYTEDFSYLSVQGRMNKLYARLSVFAKERYKALLAEATAALDGADDAKEQAVRIRWRLREEYKAFLAMAENTLSAGAAELYLSALASFDPAIAEETKRYLDEKTVPAEDAAPLAYLYAATREIKNEVKYLIVDEAQDYTRLHFETMKLCFKKASITFLGDENQTVCPLSSGAAASDIAAVFPGAEVKHLTKTYRSTAPISEFCGSILSLDNVDYMKRAGEAVSVSTLASKQEYEAAMIREAALQCKSHRTCAIIFPTEGECRRLYETHGRAAGCILMSGEDTAFRTGCVILPVYMAKGLEFDAVILPNQSYRDEALRHMRYTACTRALHVLKLFQYEEKRTNNL